MKRCSLFVLLLCASLVLTACTATDPDNLFEMPEGGTTPSDAECTQTEPDETESAASDTEEVILYTGTYPYGNMQKNVPPGNFVLLGNEVMFSSFAYYNPLLYCYDLVSEEVRLYCGDATCKHEYGDENNPCAAAEFNSNLEVYNGELYGLVSAPEKGPGTHYPAVARKNGIEYVLSSGIGGFFHHGDNLYLKTSDSALMVLEEGQREPRMLMEEWNGRWEVIFGDCLYANTNDRTVIRVDLTAEELKAEVILSNAAGMTDGQHIYYVDDNTSKLYRCDMDGSNPQLLVDQDVLFASMNFDDEYFYYRILKKMDQEYPEDGDMEEQQKYMDSKFCGYPDSYDIYRFPKEDPTQIEKIATLPDSVYQVFTVPGTGKLFIGTYAPQGEDRPLYVMNTDGSNMKVLEIPEY